MGDEIQLGFGKPHEEAIAFIRGKPPVSRAVFDRLLPELRARAFTVTGIEGFDQLQRIRDAIAGLPGGATWDEAKAEVMGQLEALGAGAERRAELLLRTHGFQAFQAANWSVAQADEDTTHLQYLATEDDRVRDTHRALNGVIVPKDDPFWDKHFPPWEWGCRCRVRPINPDLLDEARQRDATVPPEDRHVIDGPALDRLRQGQIIRNGRAYNVSSPAERPGGDQAFQWNPGDLHLDPARLEQRYEPEVWASWRAWAERTEIRPGTTVWQWMNRGAKAPESPRPAPAAPVVPGPVPSPAATPEPIPGDSATKTPAQSAIARLEAAGFSAARAAALSATPAGATKHLETVKFASTSGGALYRPSTKTIEWGSDSAKWSGQPMSLHHEFGHHLHIEMGLVTSAAVDPGMVAAIEKDFAAWKRWARALDTDWRRLFKNGAYNERARKAFKDALGVTDGIFASDPTGAKRLARAMDTVMAISGGKYGEGHSKAYMKRGNQGPMEAFANTYSAIVDGDSAFQTMFPKLTSWIKKAIGL